MCNLSENTRQELFFISEKTIDYIVYDLPFLTRQRFFNQVFIEYISSYLNLLHPCEATPAHWNIMVFLGKAYCYKCFKRMVPKN